MGCSQFEVTSLRKTIVHSYPYVSKLRSLPSKDGVYINIAVFLPLTGPYRNVGESMKNSMLLARRELRAHHMIFHFWDIGNEKFTINDKISGLDLRNMDVILGPIFAKEIEVIYSLARKYGLPMIAYSDRYELFNKPGLFSVSISKKQQLERITSYAAENGFDNIYAILVYNRNVKDGKELASHRLIKRRFFYSKEIVGSKIKMQLSNVVISLKKANGASSPSCM